MFQNAAARDTNMSGKGASGKGLDQTSLKSLALHYVARRATTAARLKRYLQNKIRVKGWDGGDAPDLDATINAIVQAMVTAGYVDDLFFAQARSRTLSRRGLGAQRLAADLQQAGIDSDVARRVIAETAPSPLRAAIAYAQRRRLGPFSRPDTNGQDTTRIQHKQMAAMIRAGHDPETARRVISATDADALGAECADDPAE